MKDIKNLKNNGEARELEQEELEKVSGSVYYFTQNLSLYSSGDTPKYKIGETVKIDWARTPAHDRMETLCKITGVSATKNGGTYCKEYTYTVQTIPTPSGVLSKSETVYNVYESCLRRNNE